MLYDSEAGNFSVTLGGDTMLGMKACPESPGEPS
jgi:hypothetical protein